MTQSLAKLADRGIIAVGGADAEKLLQGLITNDVPAAEGDAAFAGLLSPQGKIQFDFFIVRSRDGFLLDVARAQVADLVKRLTLYRLRSKVDIADRSNDVVVHASQTEDRPELSDSVALYRDPRLAAMGWRQIADAGVEPRSGEDGSAAYHAHRIALGVPEGGRDYAYGDTFPHEALYDQLHGVSFSKGCYVGQEIVSRMQHRGTARKRIVQVLGDAALAQSRPEVLAGEVAIGALGSVSGNEGLALVRLDRAAEFKRKGVALTAAGVPITLRKPAFASFALEPESETQSP